HPKFERDGFDVHSEEEITFPQAALGTKIDVATLDGDVTLKIPAGTQPGTVMRLKGKGVPFLKRSGRGDHYVTVRVSVPTKLTRQQRRILEGWE
ncbi:MAG: DnaJ C-terminal domain-containing protein, partial [bacterium]